MSKYLISTCEVYRVANENEAKKLIEESKTAKGYSLTKYISEYKNRKAKGEIIDEYYKVTLTKTFNDIKEPTCSVNIDYTREEGFFPEPVNAGSEDEEEDEVPWN